MTRDVVWCEPHSSLEEAALIMAQCDCGELPVVDENEKVIGVITDRDITCRSPGLGKDPQKMTVSNCMSSPAVTIAEESDIDKCLQLMKANQVRRIIVVNKEGTCCGVVSLADIAESSDRSKTGEAVQKVSKASNDPFQVQMH